MPSMARPTLFVVGASGLAYYAAGTATNRDTQYWAEKLGAGQLWRGHTLPGSLELQRARLLDLKQRLTDTLTALRDNTLALPSTARVFVNRTAYMAANNWLGAGEGRQASIMITANNWLGAGEGRQASMMIAGLCASIFVAWQIPALRGAMRRHFLHDPLSGRHYTMATSIFSHSAFMHLAFNSLALLSFGAAANSLLRKQQASTASPLPESTSIYHFMAFFLTAGLFSSYVSHIISTRVRLPALLRTLTSTSFKTDTLAVSGAHGVIAPSLGVIRGWRTFDHWAHLGGAAFGVAYYRYGADFWDWAPVIKEIVMPSRTSQKMSENIGHPKLKSITGDEIVLKPESELALQQLAQHVPSYPPPNYPKRFPRSRHAAVLVALFVGRLGDIYVLLSRRSLAMRTYGGDTSLPGGRVEPKDRSIEDTARREAFEEIGLPIDKRRLKLLCALEPFLSGNNLIVTPVVVLIKDPSLKPKLNPPEVDLLFTHPLRSFLYEDPPESLFPLGSHPPVGAIRVIPKPPPPPSQESASNPSTSEKHKPPQKKLFQPKRPRFSTTSYNARGPAAYPPPEQPAVAPYHSFVDVAWGPAKEPVRFHRFLTGREEQGVKPIFGLTASILLHTAIIAYNPQKPDFQVQAPNQRSTEERFATAMRTVPVLRDAARAEGLKEWGPWDDEKVVPKSKL
ncbi:unnamed protein product [Rhizoctonia solani]|uniref:Nudix hydrolase domain-containing protein n=1 Tax=Rhizoctonia solani TaxID=456999 RepID=A0A8H3DBC8_9AGAM|nr:unnamed protein product [Rhizoctonia solani]